MRIAVEHAKVCCGHESRSYEIHLLTNGFREAGDALRRSISDSLERSSALLACNRDSLDCGRQVFRTPIVCTSKQNIRCCDSPLLLQVIWFGRIGAVVKLVRRCGQMNSGDFACRSVKQL